MTFERAAKMTGLDYSTIARWKKLGREQKKGQYAEFFEDLKRAEAEGEAGKLAEITRAAKGGQEMVETREEWELGVLVRKTVTRKLSAPQWQAAAWLLERRHPELWARKYEVKAEIDGVNEKAAAIAVLVRQMIGQTIPDPEIPAEQSPTSTAAN
jgi:hypothetical protein